MTLRFRYNDIESLRDLVQQHPGKIACVLMEAETTTPPTAGYLEAVKGLCEQHGMVLIFDEMITIAPNCYSAEFADARSDFVGIGSVADDITEANQALPASPPRR